VRCELNGRTRIHEFAGDQSTASTNLQGHPVNIARQHTAHDLIRLGYAWGLPMPSPALTVLVLVSVLVLLLALSPAVRRVIGLNRIAALDCCYATLVIFAVMLSTFTIVRAHDHERPELNGWYQSLRSGKGPCCDGSDAKRLDDADWESRDGHYRVRIDGEWVDVPADAVVGGPNRAGRTMVWTYYKDGHPEARCFMPGSMS
jgi:hypothetical protein